MKRIFLIHSAITFLVAEGTLQHLGVDPEDAVYLSSRGYVPPPCRARVVPIDFTHNPESFPTTKNPFVSWRRLAKFDRWIDGLVGGAEYHLFLPQTGQRFMRLLMSHARCRGTSLIEEGLASHMTLEVANQKSPSPRIRTKDKVAYRGRLGRPTFFDPEVEAAFGLHEGSFPGFQGRVIVKRPTLADVEAPHFRQGETLLVLCGLASYGLLDIESDLAGLADALGRIAERGDTGIRYKLHPGLVTSPMRGRYEALLKERCAELHLTVEPLGDSVVLEIVVEAQPDIPVVVNLSSVGVYAAQTGSTVTSYAELIASVDRRYRSIIDGFPSVFFDSVRFFEPRGTGVAS